MKPVPGRANERPHRNGQDEGERADLPDSSEDGRQVLPFYRQPQTYNNRDYISEQNQSNPNEMPRRNFIERQSAPYVSGEERIEKSLSGFYHSTKDLQDKDRLGKSKHLPNFAAEWFDSGGGFLDIPKYDVTLMVPNGAIEPGMVQEVYLHVDAKTTEYLIHEARGPLLGHVVTFGPPGLNFKRHVILHIPLICEDDDQGGDDDNKRPPMKTTDWSNIAADTDNDVIVKDRQIIMVLSSFARQCSELKKFKVCVTTPVFNHSEEVIHFYVKLWEDESTDCHQKGSNEEAGNIDVNLESGELYLKLSNLHHRMKSKSGAGGYISTDMLKENSTNEVLFQLHHTDGSYERQGSRRDAERLCDIQIRQRSDHEASPGVLLHEIHVYIPKKSTGQDEPSDDSPSSGSGSGSGSGELLHNLDISGCTRASDAEHQERGYQPHQPKLSSDQDQPDLPPDMRKWTTDEVRRWLLYIGIPGVSVSHFVSEETDGDDLAKYSDSDLGEKFMLSKNLRELILTSRNSLLEKVRAQSQQCGSQRAGFVSTTVSSYMADTDLICNDYLIEPESSTIHLTGKTDRQSTSIDLSVSVDVIKIPGGNSEQEAVKRIVNELKRAVQVDSFSELVTDIGNVFNENYAELVSLDGLICVVRFRTREGLYKFGERCNSGELAAKLAKILITEKIREGIKSELDIRLTLIESDYVRGMRHFDDESV
ncbi:uncharacterized protein LOC117299565 [Asterias rubens]|uniref:uncharacterized protein LOC117299565 n=1 Tax=Asterias rubens TaxID=7604 RepID=UPI001455B7FB|nr:uncharacterized protein LOC117299565 [Asterias rubens]